MKITKEKIMREMVKNHEWGFAGREKYEIRLIEETISDTLKIVDKILKEQKGFSIK